MHSGGGSKLAKEPGDGPDNIKYRNLERKKKSYFSNLTSPKEFGRFDTSGSLVALFVPEIWPKIQECRNPELQKSNNF